MFKRFTVIAFFAFTSLGLTSQASATLILDDPNSFGNVSYASGDATPTTIGGYEMTDFAVTNSNYDIVPDTNGGRGTTTSIDSPLSGSLQFLQGGTSEEFYLNGSAVGLERRLADSEGWWINGEATDYDIFTTDLHLVTILLPENTRAFSFNVGANLADRGRNNAWLIATESNELGISKTNFNVNNENTPGFGMYTDNSSGSCSAITSVTIDPLLWGFGNFSINQDDCPTNVPEPAPIALLALGLIGLGAFRKRNNT